MKDWLMELCPEIAEWQAEIIAEQVRIRVESEREACARLCADYTAWSRGWGQDNNHMAAAEATNECAAAIRARGKE